LLYSEGCTNVQYVEVSENIEAVLWQIVEALRDPHPHPLPGREREKKCPRPAGERVRVRGRRGQA
jgi:hypothetical protein